MIARVLRRRLLGHPIVFPLLLAGTALALAGATSAPAAPAWAALGLLAGYSVFGST